MKIAAVTRAMDADGGFDRTIVHTGQHYDQNMFHVMFDDLGLPRPDINLEVSGGSHAYQTGEIMKRFEPVVLEHRPDLVVVVGDVNSTAACAMVATKLHVPVAHIESGLRSFDRRMPEEINRIVTDSISDLLFVSEPSGVANLRAEGTADEKIHFVGNVMIDTLMHHRDRANRSGILDRLGVSSSEYAVLTLHRPSNVDDRATFAQLLDAIEQIQQDLPIVFPVHPRTQGKLEEHGLDGRLAAMDNILRIAPVGYLDFLKLMAEARLLLTDSGGIQEEATILRVQCLTLRENTERPITIEAGYNQLVGTDASRIMEGYRRAMNAVATSNATTPEKWDGRAGERIVKCLRDWFDAGASGFTDDVANAAVAATVRR
jgi:UDP-N-acetylglucosamine 2-epimerase (non-hydrolysing)